VKETDSGPSGELRLWLYIPAVYTFISWCCPLLVRCSCVRADEVSICCSCAGTMESCLELFHAVELSLCDDFKLFCSTLTESFSSAIPSHVLVDLFHLFCLIYCRLFLAFTMTADVYCWGLSAPRLHVWSWESLAVQSVCWMSSRLMYYMMHFLLFCVMR